MPSSLEKSLHSNIALAALLLSTCTPANSKTPPAPTPPRGHFALTSKICEGHTIVVPSVAEWLDMTEGGSSWIVRAPGCHRRLPDLRLVATSTDTLLTADESAAQCQPNPCAVAVAAVVDGRPGRATFDCPSRTPHEYILSQFGTKM